MKITLALTALVFSVAPPLPGQESRKTLQVTKPQRVSVDTEEEEQEADRPLPPSVHMGATPGQSPQRIAPGGSGLVMIVLALRQRAIMEPGKPFSVNFEREQGALTLGAWRRQPPGLGKHHEHSRGRRVYDDTAVVEIPVAVAAHAEHGEHNVTVRVVAQVHDGETGLVLGQFTQDVFCPIVVATPVSVVASGSVRAAAPPTAADDRGFALSAPSTVRLPAGSRQVITVRLDIPDGFYISRDEDVDVPKLDVVGAGDGVLTELLDEPEAELGAQGAIYRGHYARSVVLSADAGASPSVRRTVVTVRFLPCDVEVCYPPRTLSQSFELEVTDGGQPAVIYPVETRAAEPAERGAESARDVAAPGLWPYFLLGAAAAVVALLVIKRVW